VTKCRISPPQTPRPLYLRAYTNSPHVDSIQERHSKLLRPLISQSRSLDTKTSPKRMWDDQTNNSFIQTCKNQNIYESEKYTTKCTNTNRNSKVLANLQVQDKHTEHSCTHKSTRHKTSREQFPSAQEYSKRTSRHTVKTRGQDPFSKISALVDQEQSHVLQSSLQSTTPCQSLQSNTIPISNPKPEPIIPRYKALPYSNVSNQTLQRYQGRSQSLISHDVRQIQYRSSTPRPSQSS